MLIHCVPILGRPWRDSPSTHGARSSGTDRGRPSAPCAYNRGSRLASPCQKCPHVVYCFAVDILKFLTTSSLDLCFVSEVGWDIGDAPGGSRCVLGEVIQHSQALQDPGEMVISGAWVQNGSRDSGTIIGQREGIPVLFMLYCD